MTGPVQAAPQPRKRQGAARRKLLDAAARRFYADGVSATGIDTITAEAGVAKMSLYNNFSSKADLVLAYLDARHEEWLDLYRRRMESARDGRDGVLAVFDAYADHARFAYERGFRGCGLLNAAAELPTGDEGRAVVRRHKEHVEALLSAHVAQLLVEADPRRWAPWRSTCRSSSKGPWHGPVWRARQPVWSTRGRWPRISWSVCDRDRRTRGRACGCGVGVRAARLGAVGHHGYRRDARTGRGPAGDRSRRHGAGRTAPSRRRRSPNPA